MKEPNMEARDVAREIVENLAKQFDNGDILDLDKLQKKITTALFLQEKEAWNQAVDACKKVVSEYPCEQLIEWKFQDEITDKIEELRRP